LELAIAFWQKDVTGSLNNTHRIPGKMGITRRSGGADGRCPLKHFSGDNSTRFWLLALAFRLFAPMCRFVQTDRVHPLVTVFALGAR
jgi:hypothetical protein